MNHDENWPADAPRAGHAHRIDVLTQTLREMAVQVVLSDPQPWGPEEVDQDPLSPEGLGAHTRRLLKLIEASRTQKDVSLLYSLRRELLLTRWALVKLRPVRSQGAAEKQAAPHTQDARRDPSDQRTRFQRHGRRRSEARAASVLTAVPSTPAAP